MAEVIYCIFAWYGLFAACQLKNRQNIPGDGQCPFRNDPYPCGPLDCEQPCDIPPACYPASGQEQEPPYCPGPYQDKGYSEPRRTGPSQCPPEYRPPPGCCMPPGQEEAPCFPDSLRKSGFSEPRCTRPPQGSPNYRPPPGCCMPPGEEEDPCIPDQCMRRMRRLDPVFKEPPPYARLARDCAPPQRERKPKEVKPPKCQQKQKEAVPVRCPRKTEDVAPQCPRKTQDMAPQCQRRAREQVPHLCREYQPPPGCCMPPGQEKPPCVFDPCRKSGYSEPRANRGPMLAANMGPPTQDVTMLPGVAQSMGYGPAEGPDGNPNKCTCPKYTRVDCMGGGNKSQKTDCPSHIAQLAAALGCTEAEAAAIDRCTLIGTGLCDRYRYI